jgi:hypothetical protein
MHMAGLDLDLETVQEGEGFIATDTNVTGRLLGQGRRHQVEKRPFDSRERPLHISCQRKRNNRQT